MSKKSKLINGIIIVASIIVLIIYITIVDGLSNILHVFAQCNPVWLLFGFLLMIFYWYLEGHILNDAVGVYGPKMSARNCAKNCMIGQFFNNITPSSTGGQPMQAYYMHRCGISVGFATSALLIRFIVYQISLTFVSVIVLIFKYKEFAAQIDFLNVLLLFGFTMNTLIAAMLLLIGLKKNAALVIMHFFVKLLAKIRIIKQPEKQLQTVDREVAQFHEGFEAMLKHKGRLVWMHALSVLQLVVFFSVNVVIAGAFGVHLSFAVVFTIIAGAACVQISSSFVPLPGAAGGAELAYYMLYGSIFSSSQLSAAVLTWRLFTFYFPIVVGLIFSRDIFGKKQTPEISENIL